LFNKLFICRLRSFRGLPVCLIRGRHIASLVVGDDDDDDDDDDCDVGDDVVVGGCDDDCDVADDDVVGGGCDVADNDVVGVIVVVGGVCDDDATSGDDVVGVGVVVGGGDVLGLNRSSRLTLLTCRVSPPPDQPPREKPST